jgi:hypothetical protein
MAKNTFLKGLFAVGLIGLTACSVTPQEYADETPTMDMKTYFNGPIQAWGLFQNYREKVIKRFHVSMTGKWKDDKGTLDEHFTYSDGTTQRRVWNLVRIDANNYTGTADDVVGEARGVAYGHALRWQYTMALEVDDDTYHVQFDDWMYLIDENTVINRSVMSKFGVDVGEVILVFIKPQAVNTTNETRGPFRTPEIQNISQITSAIL